MSTSPDPLNSSGSVPTNLQPIKTKEEEEEETKLANTIKEKIELWKRKQDSEIGLNLRGVKLSEIPLGILKF